MATVKEVAEFFQKLAETSPDMPVKHYSVEYDSLEDFDMVKLQRLPTFGFERKLESRTVIWFGLYENRRAGDEARPDLNVEALVYKGD